MCPCLGRVGTARRVKRAINEVHASLNDVRVWPVPALTPAAEQQAIHFKNTEPAPRKTATKREYTRVEAWNGRHASNSSSHVTDSQRKAISCIISVGGRGRRCRWSTLSGKAGTSRTRRANSTRSRISRLTNPVFRPAMWDESGIHKAIGEDGAAPSADMKPRPVRTAVSEPLRADDSRATARRRRDRRD